VVHMGVGSLADAMRTLFGGSARMAVAPPGDVVGAAWWLRVVGRQTLGALVPPLGAVAAMALIVGAVQARGVFATEALRANWSRLSPARNIKRIVGVRAIVELAKSLFKLAVVAAAMASALSLAWSELLALGQQPPFALASV